MGSEKLRLCLEKEPINILGFLLTEKGIETV